MATELPEDRKGQPIPALSLLATGAHHLSATAVSARNTTAFNEQTQVVSLFATQPVYIKMGNSSVTATTADHYFPEGVYYDFATKGNTHIAVLRANVDGAVHISEKE